QTCGRAARNAQGRVIMYADKITKSIKSTIEITQKRRKVQEEYNTLHGITPKTIAKEKAADLLETFGGEPEKPQEKQQSVHHYTKKEVESKIKQLEAEMKKAAKELKFEEAAHLRDLLKHYKSIDMLAEDS
ncbi:MAG: excinuclease ABC subunit B, partial [Chlamydiae bacterium]|nr:excinuclease ABC subunit B [Chlamydiota bacterium]